MNNDKYKFTTAVISLVLSVMAFIAALVCMIFYVKSGGAIRENIIMLPLLFICVFLSVASTVFSFINLSHILGRIAFLLCLTSIIFIVVSFIYLF